MTIEFTPLATPYVVAFITNVALLAVLWRHRDRRGARGFIVDVVGVILLSGTVALQMVSVDLATKQFWWNWRFLAVSLMSIGYLTMAVEYTNREDRITVRTGLLLLVVPVLTQVAVWTNDVHGLVYAHSVDPATGLAIPAFGPLYWVYAIPMVAYVLLGAALLSRLFLSMPGFKKQAATLVATIAFVLVGAVVWWLGIVTVDTLALTSTVKVVAFYVAVTRLELLDIVPVARSKVIDNMRDAVVVVNAADRIVDVNPAAERLLDGERVVGKPLADACPADISQYDGVTDVQDELAFEVDGEQRHFDLRISPLYEREAARTGRLIVLRDITPLKSREEELTVLNRIVRHDIRNEMNVITGRGDLLAPHVDPAGKEHFELMMESSTHVIELTEVVGDLMETIAGNDDLSVEPIPLERTIRNQLEKARTRYPDATFEYESCAPTTRVYANEMLSSVFTNLFNNAVLHNDGDQPEVRITVEDRGDAVRVHVADDGPGVPADRREEIFGRGRKGLESEGTGVGLYLVDTLVTGYGGDVWVDDADMGGAVFTVELPTVTDQHDAAADRSATVSTPRE
ncbi:histidine kinase N-terminal 7TM domain-containing protein [Halosolutus amylolyticus]|uniref:histidine kinase n=1 Tax=Halosolutus amylolyticus TaxID=2932267 RepID=A0ABD5PUD9_9EURY|nr:histidine kinase N-terminal 7TM domain-containing protein [Halosolutus amylolyticus]